MWQVWDRELALHREGEPEPVGTPETLHPKPETRNPKPETRNPKPETRNPKPYTRNPTPETRNPKPYIIHLTYVFLFRSTAGRDDSRFVVEAIQFYTKSF